MSSKRSPHRDGFPPWRRGALALALGCAAFLGALSSSPARAQGLLDHLLPPIGGGEGGEGGEGNPYLRSIELLNVSLTGDGTLVLTASSEDIFQLPNLLPIELPILPGAEVRLTATLPSGFAITSATCSEGVDLVELGPLTYGLSITGNVSVENLLSCTFNTINAVGASVSAIVPTLVRRGDMIMALDMGLDRQVDLLATGGGDGDSEWEEAAAGITTTTTAAFAGDASAETWSAPRYSLGATSQAAEPSRIAFATSLQQSRQRNVQPPYALGARARPPAPAKGKLDVWAEGYYAQFDDDTPGSKNDGHTGVLYLGADYLLTPTLLIGSLVQFDDTEQEFDWLSRRTSATGWLAGPYATFRLPHNLFFQARAAWGQSDNDITIVPGSEDHFDTERWLVKGTLIGQYRYGLWQFQPRASVGYIEEEQESYTNSFNVVIPSTTISLGQAKAGSQIAYRHRLADGSLLEPSVLLEGIWNFHEDAGAINLDDFVTDGNVRGRAEAGLTFYTASGVAIGGSISYDGIGSDDYQSIGGRARVRVPLN